MQKGLARLTLSLYSTVNILLCYEQTNNTYAHARCGRPRTSPAIKTMNKHTGNEMSTGGARVCEATAAAVEQICESGAHHVLVDLHGKFGVSDLACMAMALHRAALDPEAWQGWRMPCDVT